MIIELALGATIAAIPEGSEARAQFEASLLRDLSTTLMVSSTRIHLLSIHGGSLIVKFRVNHDEVRGTSLRLSLCATLCDCLTHTHSHSQAELSASMF